MCGWQVELCDPLVTHGPYLSALAVVLPIIRRYTNNQITLTFTLIQSQNLPHPCLNEVNECEDA